MLRAEQNALIQEANQQLLSIRKDELDYFVQVFSDFGTQAALLAGFTLSTLTQVPVLDSGAHFIWRYLFWVSCAIVMVASLHVVLTTTFINIFGSGLALRGPAGSMVRAVEGMVKELDAIFIAFFISIFFFQAATAATSFVVMEDEAAWISLGIYIVGSYIWYKYCIRIFNRFQLRSVGFAWKDDEEQRPERRSASSEASASPYVETAGSGGGTPKKHGLLGKLARMTHSGPQMTEKLAPASSSGVPEEEDRPISAGSSSVTKKKGNSSNYQEGYLTARGLGKAYFASEWSRFYFVLEADEFFYYRSKEAFKLDPRKSVKNRPISLADYVVCTMKDKSSGALQLVLEPALEDDNRRKWEFRCDTMEELKQWVTALAKGGIQASEGAPGLFWPSPTLIGGQEGAAVLSHERSGAKSVATSYTIN